MKYILIIAISVSSLYALAQAPTIHPLPGGVTWCPGERLPYEVQTTGAQQTGCKYLWSVTNGVIKDGQGKRQVEIEWKDSPEKGTLSVTLTDCTSAENTTKSEDYVIRSVKGEDMGPLLTFPTGQALCGTTSVNATIPKMYVTNTSTLYQVYEADGYEWSFPNSEWTGSSTTNQITITPNNGCSEGFIKVRAYINSCLTSTKSYSEWSEEISLRTVPSLKTSSNNLTSYTLLCGSQNTVTFSVPAISCATGYTWEFPSGWKTTGNAISPVTVSGSQNNTITLKPPTTNSNSLSNLVPIEGSGVWATVNLSCKSYLASPVSINFSDVALSTPNFSGVSVNDVCTASSGSVSLSNVSGADSYSWWITTPGTMYINGGAYTSSNPLITTSSSVTVSVPTVTTGYNNTIAVKANRANGCTGSQLRTKNIWAGKPLSIGGSLTGPSSAVRGNYVTYTINNPTSPNGGSFDWSLPLGTICTVGSSTCTSITGGGDGSNTMTVRFGNNTSSGNIQIRKQNNCGSGGALLKYVTITGSIDGGGGGGCNPCPIIEVYPNPTNSTHLTVAFTTETQIELEENNSTALISVYTLAGQVVHKKEYDVKENQRFELPILDLPEGNYVLKVNFNDREEIHHLKLKQ